MLKKFGQHAKSLTSAVLLGFMMSACGGGSSIPSNAINAAPSEPTRTEPAASVTIDHVLDKSTHMGLGLDGVYGWVSAPVDFLKGQQADVVGPNPSGYSFQQAFPTAHISFGITTGTSVVDWQRPAITTNTLQNGIQPGNLIESDRSSSTEKGSVRWINHHRYPTIMTEQVGNSDWSAYGAISIPIYSTKATGEVVTLGVRNDQASTLYLDYWTQDIAIDWVGWKRVTLPFDQFEAIGKPLDWAHVDALYFFGKHKRRSPHPETDLTLGQLGLVLKTHLQPSSPAVVAVPLLDISYSTAAVRRNHADPELTQDPTIRGESTQSGGVSQQAFFAASRALYGYNPRYDPGVVSLDPKGRAYVRSDANSGLVVQWLSDDQRQWLSVDLTSVVKNWVGAQSYKGKPWSGASISSPAVPLIRFDQDGDAYLLVEFLPKDSGIEGGVLLLHCKNLQTAACNVYKLNRPGPNYFRGVLADFEKIDTYNTDALLRPPAITLSTSIFGYGTNQAGYLLLPIKNADGTLTLPTPIEISPFALIGPVHSGSNNFVVSKGNKVYMVYAYLPPPTKTGDVDPQDLTYMAKMPAIPANHPANNMTWVESSTSTRNSKQGVPSFVRSYDRATQTLSAPVFVGYGGFTMDGHNWPSIALDADSGIHVLLNSHNMPPTYTRTLNPDDISQWTGPVYVATSTKKYARHPISSSYANLSFDRNNQVIMTYRSDTTYYNHRLSIIRKPAKANVQPAGSEVWDVERSLVVPHGDGYHLWNQKTAYNPIKHIHYMSYYDNGVQTQLTNNAYLFNRFIWPDSEPAMTSGVIGSGVNDGLPVQGKMTLFTTPRADLTLLMSADGGQTWRPATSADF